MRVKLITVSVLSGLSLLLAGSASFAGTGSAGDVHDVVLEQNFVKPPDSAKPYTWWHWMNGNVSKVGITADLEAMHNVGIGGVQAFHVSDHIPHGPIGYMSDEWLGMMEHAIKEADRLGLKIGLHNCAGWSSSGGPWITPEFSMQKVVWSETKVRGPKSFTETLKQPEKNHGYYQDIALLAFRTPTGNRFTVKEWKTKAGFVVSHFVVSHGFKTDTRTIKKNNIISKNTIVDLSGKMDKSGKLSWQVPNGNWTILRFGHTSTGVKNHPAPGEGRGLECDKFSRAAAELHWENSMQKVIDEIGPLTGKVFDDVLIDSYEVRCQNWTRGFDKKFRNRFGYDLIPYLPCLTGRVVENLDITERFLWDFRRLIADLFTENYFGHFAEMCHQNGMDLSIEPYGRSGNFDNFSAAAQADRPMGEWWAQRSQRWHHWSAKLAASAAHAYGRKFVGAEAFTAGGAAAAWVNHPYLLKSQGDYFYCKGINRFIFHDYAHHPGKNLKPGMTMGPHGFQCNRGNTWWDQGRAWMSYLARCQYLLQEGTQVADLFYFPGENVLNELGTREELKPVPPYGYDYDSCDANIIMQMKAKNGRMVLPSGMSYKVLVLPQHDSMRPELLKKIAELADAGIAVTGIKPVRSPSLQNYPECDLEVQKVSKKINWNKSLKEILAELNLNPDFDYVTRIKVPDTEYPGTGIEYIHRKIGAADVYFISNQHQYQKTIQGIFRINGKLPELWHPDTGEIETAPVHAATDDGRTTVPLHLDPAGSVFVVFRKPAPAVSVVDVARNGTSFISDKKEYVLQIKNAVYGVLSGTSDQQVDITEKLQNMVHNNQLSVVAGNQLAGDPAMQIAKEMRVEYVLNGKTFVKTVKEKERLAINRSATLETAALTADLKIRNGQIILTARKSGEYKLKTGDGRNFTIDIDSIPDPVDITGPWQLSFPPDWGAPAKVKLEELISWPEHSDDGVKYFSGTATYNKKFNWSPPSTSGTDNELNVSLNLGHVEIIAEVKLNGKDLGILWKPPFTVDVSDVIRKGANKLEIKVTNLWPNRLIGDEQYKDDNDWKQKPAGKRRFRKGGLSSLPDWFLAGEPRPSSKRFTWTTWKHYNENSALLESGLIGPVTLTFGMEKAVGAISQ